jgi:succinate dehydrogenase/fumarate reductase flavoprotein subunit
LVSWLSGIHSRVTSAENHPGIGFPIQIPLLHKSHQQRIAASDNGSRILTNTWIVKLTQDDPGVPGSRVNGAIICEHKPGTSIVHYQVKAKLVILATGGFQGSPSMTAKYLGYGGDNIFVRSNRGSVGDGLSLAIAAGAGTSKGLNTFYGHLLAAPLRAEDASPHDYLPLAQYRK